MEKLNMKDLLHSLPPRRTKASKLKEKNKEIVKFADKECISISSQVLSQKVHIYEKASENCKKVKKEK